MQDELFSHTKAPFSSYARGAGTVAPQATTQLDWLLQSVSIRGHLLPVHVEVRQQQWIPLNKDQREAQCAVILCPVILHQHSSC